MGGGRVVGGGGGGGGPGSEGGFVEKEVLGAIGRHQLLHGGHQRFEPGHPGGCGIGAQQHEAGGHGGAQLSGDVAGRDLDDPKAALLAFAHQLRCRRLVDDGHPAGPEPLGHTGPVLVVHDIGRPGRLQDGHRVQPVIGYHHRRLGLTTPHLTAVVGAHHDLSSLRGGGHGQGLGRQLDALSADTCQHHLPLHLPSPYALGLYGLPPMNLLVGGLLSDAAAVNPNGTAATLDEEAVTYRELEHSATRMAEGLLERGLEAGARVLWWCDPDLRSLAGFAAAARAGLVFAPLNPAFGQAEAEASIRYLRPALVVADRAHLAAAAALGGPPDGVGTALGAGPIGASPVVMSLDDLGRAAAGPGPASDPPAVDDRDPHIIYLTSGTTGAPKGVVVSHRASWLRSFPGGSTFASGIAGDGGILVSFPLFHYGGWHYVLEAWHHRCASHICRTFDGPSLVAAAARWRPVAMYCIPAVWKRVLATAPAGEGLESVRHADTGTSAAPPALLAEMRRAMPEATTSVLYGSSEGGHHTTLHHRDVARRPGSVGRVAPPGVIALSGRTEGEILYRSPTLMDGYFDRPDETEAALAGGWYHTGDLGTMDDDGYIWITGRAREVIRTGGESVAPVEVEQALAGRLAVSDLAVTGIADEQWGEIVCLAVVPAPGAAPPTPDSVRSYLSDRLASFKHPRRLIEVAAIPRTPATGQVQRTLLRDVVGAKL